LIGLLLLFRYAGKTQGVLCQIWDLWQIQETLKKDVFIQTAGVFA
jgi:hypothetical protein